MERRKIQDINIPKRSVERPTRQRVSGRTNPKPARENIETKHQAKAPSGSVSVKRKSISRPSSVRRSKVQSSRAQPSNLARKRIPSRSPLVTGGDDKRSGSGARGLWVLAGVLLLVLAYVGSVSLATAHVQISLREQVASLDTVLQFYEDGIEDAFDYDTMQFVVEADHEVGDVDMVATATKASGTIIIYNNYSDRPQRLLEETRFEDPSGRIYKLAKGNDVIVPGQTVVDGEVVPGALEVVVYADEPGADYNQDPTDFVIPGFRSGPKFDGFYARSVGPIEGGWSGEKPALTSEQEAEIVEKLRTEAVKQAQLEADYRIPEGYYALASGVNYDWGELNFAEGSVDGMVRVVLSVNVRFVLVREDELEKGILAAALSLEEQGESDLVVVNFDSLTYDIETGEEDENDYLSVRVTGDVRLRWFLSKSEIAQLSAGKSQAELRSVLERQPEIKSLEAEITPAWVRTMPKNLERITVLYENIDS